MSTNKRKIINDPVYGFINISSETIFDIIEHRFFQRLRRIQQLGLTGFVYPGALHTRFQHALGAFHLMTMAIEVINGKGHQISDEEAEAVSLAILLHDIGHGPFSHTLEFSFFKDITHEDISLLFMEKLNDEFHGKLSLCIRIFRNQYHKKYLHQLVSSQLDMDRLDYLCRDSFFTGVSEGVIGFDRIIKMLNVQNGELVVEAKGIYSIEKFLVARRLMYWQVYLHKTVLSAELLLIKILQRAKELVKKNIDLFATPSLKFFLYHDIRKSDFYRSDLSVLSLFAQLDDNDIITSVKVWTEHEDFVLSYLCKSLIYRNLFKIEIQNQPFDEDKINRIKLNIRSTFHVEEPDLNYFLFEDSISNNAYSAKDDKINILYNNGNLIDISEASDMLNISVLSKDIRKYFLCYPKHLRVK